MLLGVLLLQFCGADSLSCNCPVVYEPVCGEKDGKWYASRCLALCAAAGVSATPPHGRSCGATENATAANANATAVDDEVEDEGEVEAEGEAAAPAAAAVPAWTPPPLPVDETQPVEDEGEDEDEGEGEGEEPPNGSAEPATGDEAVVEPQRPPRRRAPPQAMVPPHARLRVSFDDESERSFWRN